MKQLKPMNKISQEGNAAKNNHISNSGIFFFLIIIVLSLLLLILNSSVSNLFPQSVDLFGFQELQLIYSTINPICWKQPI